MSVFTSDIPSYDQVLAVRAERVAMVRDFLATEEGVALEEDKLLTALHEKKVVEDLIASMGREHDRPLTQALNGLKVCGSSSSHVSYL